MEQLSLFELDVPAAAEEPPRIPDRLWSRLEPALQKRATEALARILWSALTPSTEEVGNDDPSQDL